MPSGMRLSTALLLCALAPTFANAQPVDEVTVTGCGPDDATVHVPKMGIVTQEHLQAHMENMESRLDHARRTEPRSSMHRKMLEAHMADMERAMEALQGARDAQRCTAVNAGLSVEARVAMLEQRLGEIQDILDQVIKHVREAERGQ